MIIERVEIVNFRQFYGTNSISLSPDNDKNIILIGGKNGFGKTNFLLGLVWCLYGENISSIDENFKKEIRKESNYSKFMKQSLNWDAQKQNITKFSITLFLSEIEVPNSDSGLHKIKIRREYNVENLEEKITITDSQNKNLFSDDESLKSFVNDFLIPIDAAKFVFFDAEKIASLAELSIKDEISVLNDALGKILGLDLYMDLVEDLEIYKNQLKKENANSVGKDQISNIENAIIVRETELENIDYKILKNESLQNEIKSKINEYDKYLNENSNSSQYNFNRESLVNEINQLSEKKKDVEANFFEQGNFFPLAILSGKMEEVREQLNKEKEKTNDVQNTAIFREKLSVFIEKLFNEPPEPEDGSMTFKNKAFYWEKAKTIAEPIFFNNVIIDNIEDFELDLNKNDEQLISDALNVVYQQSSDLFEQSFSDLNKINIELNKLERNLKLLDSETEDDIILDYLSKKANEEIKYRQVTEEIGLFKSNKIKIFDEIQRQKAKYQRLLETVDLSKKIKDKISITEKYIKTIQQFINSQKRSNSQKMELDILNEMTKLMHKMEDQNHLFVADVQVNILPDGGLKVTLFNKSDEEIKKEVLSQGEKQIYISSLIKALVNQAIQDFPIFIDTPLGRLDNEHIKNILTYYYPDLSKQVIILSTNNEITRRRYNEISANVAKTYLLKSDMNKTSISEGYFKSYEN